MPAIIERGMIGRTVSFSHCKGMHVVDGEFEPFEHDLIGDYSNPDKATNTLRRRMKDASITITDIEVDSDYYSMPVKLFVETAINYREGVNND